MTRHLFVLNPAAGRKNLTEQLIRAIEKLNLAEPYDIYVTDSEGAAEREAERYIAKHSGDFVRIYACGGDGTINEVVSGLVGVANASMTVYPVGSGNDFIKY